MSISMQSRRKSVHFLTVLAVATILRAEPPNPEEIQGLLPELENTFRTFRGRDFSFSALTLVDTRNQTAAPLEETTEADYRKLYQDRNRYLEAIGAVPAGTDHFGILQAFQASCKGSYNYDEKKLIVRFDRLWDLDDARYTILHEEVHAYQHLVTRYLADGGSPPPGDEGLAQKCLIEGDATLVSLCYITRSDPTGLPPVSELWMARWQALQRRDPGAFDFLPPYLKETMIFSPYISGAEFVRALYQARGSWEAFDAVYRDLPVSTEQILHPEKYLGPERDLPCRLAFGPKLMEQLAPPEPEPASDPEVMGELRIRAFLQTRGIASESALRAAAGWDGDLLLPFSPAPEEGGAVWFSTWDSPEDAAEFLAAMKSILVQDHNQPTQFSPECYQWYDWAGQGRVSHLEQRGTEVAIIFRGPALEMLGLVEGLWRTVKATPRELRRRDQTSRGT